MSRNKNYFLLTNSVIKKFEIQRLKFQNYQGDNKLYVSGFK